MWGSRVRCPECRAKNDIDRHLCVQCGAPLPRSGYESTRPSTAGRVVRVASVFVLVCVLLGIAYGIYYAADRYLLALFDSEPVEGIETATTVTGFGSTTTTTERQDRVVTGATDRYGTAIRVSQLGFPEGAPALVLVRGDEYNEGVVAAPLAAAYGGAILLVPPEGLTSTLSEEIVRLDPQQVFLIGLARPNTVTGQLEEILDDPDVKAFQGDDPAETAVLVAEEIQNARSEIERVVIVPPDGFADALSVAPLAAAQGWPILLADTDGGLPRATRDAIEELGANGALVVGTVVELDLEDVVRQVGADSDETTALVAAYGLNEGMSFEHVVIASGDSFPEALVAGAYVAADKATLLLARDGVLPPHAQALLDEHVKDVRILDILALPGLSKEFEDATTTTATTSSG